MQTKNFFQQLNIIWIALMAGQVIFFAVIFMVNIPPNEELKGTIELVALALVLSTIPLSTLIYQSIIKKGLNYSVTEQLNTYRQAFIVKMAMAEGGVLVSLVAYMLSKTIWLLPLIIGGLVWQFMQAPSRKQFIEDFRVQNEQEVPQS